jgi:hypothetical protein
MLHHLEPWSATTTSVRLRCMSLESSEKLAAFPPHYLTYLSLLSCAILYMLHNGYMMNIWWYIYICYVHIWIIYDDLTVTSLESWLVRRIIPKWPYFTWFERGYMLGLLIRDKPNLEHFCGAPFVVSSCGHCYSPGAYPNIYICIQIYIL